MLNKSDDSELTALTVILTIFVLAVLFFSIRDYYHPCIKTQPKMCKACVSWAELDDDLTCMDYEDQPCDECIERAP